MLSYTMSREKYIPTSGTSFIERFFIYHQLLADGSNNLNYYKTNPDTTELLLKHPTLIKYMEELEYNYRYFYAGCGIDSLSFPPPESYYVTPSEIIEENKNYMGGADTFGMSLLSDQVYTDQPAELQAYCLAKHLSHEMYHQLGLKVISPIYIKKILGIIPLPEYHFVQIGSTYFSTKKRKESGEKLPITMLEEGSAAYYSKQIYQAAARKLQPDLYNIDIEMQLKYQHLLNGSHQYSGNTKDGSIQMEPDTYCKAQAVIQAMEIHFNTHGFNFRRLLERFRVMGEILPFARATERVYGPNTFRNLHECQEKDSDSFYEDIQNRYKINS